MLQLDWKKENVIGKNVLNDADLLRCTVHINSSTNTCMRTRTQAQTQTREHALHNHSRMCDCRLWLTAHHARFDTNTCCLYAS